MLIPDLYKPIKNFGYFFLILGCCGFWVLLAELRDVDNIVVVWGFIGAVSLFHFLLGLGVIVKNRLSFSIFKGYLRLMYIGFPLGTYLSIKTLDYIKKNNLERYLK